MFVCVYFLCTDVNKIGLGGVNIKKKDRFLVLSPYQIVFGLGLSFFLFH